LKLFAALAAAAVLAGCATPQLVAVVPAADGHIGAVVVKHWWTERILDSAYGAQRIGSNGFIETATLTPAEVRESFGTTLDALPGRPVSYMLYFLEGRDELTAESTAELDKVFAEIKLRPLPDIVVIGHTDSVGNLAFNDRLSLARAERLREMLVVLGIPAERVEAAGRGKRELLVPTEDNVSEPRNRRVEINVR
jgi:outer membrane protein OmpA-like peptidoglycan-associated protein